MVRVLAGKGENGNYLKKLKLGTKTSRTAFDKTTGNCNIGKPSYTVYLSLVHSCNQTLAWPVLLLNLS